MTASRILALGTGAMGCYFAARLARAGHDVTLAGTWRETLDRAADRGVLVESDGEPWTARVHSCHRNALPEGAFDLVLVLVKSNETAVIAPVAARAATRDGLIASLQNGWGNREILQAAAPGRVAAGMSVTGIIVLGPAHVRGNHRRTTIGYDAGTETRVRAAAAKLAGAGLDCVVTDDIDRALWLKLAVNCALNPISALERKTNGELAKDPAARATIAAAATEVGAVAQARGTPLTEDPARMALQIADTTAGNRSSMLQDVERGATSEVDYITGPVCREGRRLGVPTPVNDRLWRAMRSLQSLPDPLPEAAA